MQRWRNAIIYSINDYKRHAFMYKNRLDVDVMASIDHFEGQPPNCSSGWLVVVAAAVSVRSATSAIPSIRRDMVLGE